MSTAVQRHETPPTNEHIRADQLARSLSDELLAIETEVSERVELAWLGEQPEGLDTTTKLVARTRSGSPVAVVVCARPAAPDLVARGTRIAETIRTMVGERLGAAIIRPLACGYVEDRSYVILPFCHLLASWRPLRVYQRWSLRTPLLSWLRDAVGAAVESHGSGEHDAASVAALLSDLAEQHFAAGDLRQAIARTIRRLESGAWRPRRAFDHNDLWLGNVMLPARSPISNAPIWPFTLIDWNGANPEGFGIYDLIRLSQALRLSNTTLLAELNAHAGALHCALEDTRSHLLASLARLYRHRECFSEGPYTTTVRNCLRRLDDALDRR